MVRPFTDSSIGYVAAPSVCDANQASSWTVRGRLYEESVFHGAQQLGASSQGTPACIGSHYAVRTEALREIGTVGPELAEDFSTSYLLNVAGWRGAFAVEAEAHGDGPGSFAAMVTQEFQWSRSLTNLFIGLIPRTARSLPTSLALEFAFRCGLYLLIAAVMVSGIALFVITCLSGVPWVSVNLFIFIAFSVLLSAWLVGMKAVIRSQGLTRPRRAPLMSWEGTLYVCTSWPFIVMGVAAAVYEQIVPRPVDFKVTPKGLGGAEPLPLKLVMPFLIISVILTMSAWIGLAHPAVTGYVGLALLSALANSIIAFAVAALHANGARRAHDLGGAEAVALIRSPAVVSIAVLALPIAVSTQYVPQLLGVLF